MVESAVAPFEVMSQNLLAATDKKNHKELRSSSRYLGRDFNLIHPKNGDVHREVLSVKHQLPISSNLTSLVIHMKLSTMRWNVSHNYVL